MTLTLCPLCGLETSIWRTIEKRPEKETLFVEFSFYPRIIWQCLDCELFVSDKRVPASFYESQYVNQTYGAELASRFQRILTLPVSESDNEARVAWLLQTLPEFTSIESWAHLKVLDVGSGLGVFPYRLGQVAGVKVTSLDPDASAVQHLQSLGLSTIQGTLEAYEPTDRFDLVTVVKVLEHVEDFDVFLTKIKQALLPDGIAYMEVPDADAASKDDELPEEFFIEHLWGFTKTSCSTLLNSLGFKPLILDAVVEPSGKRTLRVIASLT